jgi:hypothetical protein
VTTTPEPEAVQPPEVQPESEPEPAVTAPAPPPPVAKDYEIVNQPPAQPRRGFWKRLVE